MPQTINIEPAQVPQDQNVGSPTLSPTSSPTKKKGEKEAKPTLLELEAEILKFSELELNKDLFVYDVDIDINGKEYKVHTYRCGDENTETIVLLHGFGGSALLYYGMLKILATKFRVFCFDFVGMGLSSKQKFECTSYEETMDFFMTSIEKWREAVGLETFYLAGHSFGGYMAGQYTFRHQHRVKKLSLLSPVAFTSHKEEMDWSALKKQHGWFKVQIFKMIRPLVLKFWKNKTTPYSLARNKPWLARRFIRNYCYRRFELKDPIAKLMAEYMYGMLSSGEGSEEAIFYILKPPMLQAVGPLEDRIAEELTIPVDCYFGAIDYMDMSGAKRLYESKRKANFELKTVPKAAHQLTVQNPIFLAEEIVKNTDFTIQVVEEVRVVEEIKIEEDIKFEIVV